MMQPDKTSGLFFYLSQVSVFAESFSRVMLCLQRLPSEEAVTVFLTSGRADGEKMSLVNVVLGCLICIKDTSLVNNPTKPREEETFNSFYRHPALTG